MQRITLEELKHILFYAFRDHLTMKDIENIIINEEESLKENSGNCQTEFEGGKPRAQLSGLFIDLDQRQLVPGLEAVQVKYA